MKKIVRNFKNLSYSHEENAVRNATTNDELEVTQEALEEVRHCAMESTGDAYTKFYDLFMKRLTDFKHIHHVHKALKCIYYCCNNIIEQSHFLDDLRGDINFIQKLTRYRYYKSGAKEIGLPVRNLANDVIRMLAETEHYEEEEVEPRTREPQSYKKVRVQRQEQYDYDDDESGEFKFDDFEKGFQVLGRVGANMGKINGIYVLRPQREGGKNSYERLGGDREDPIVFWYWDMHTAWMISKKSHIRNKDKVTAYACIKDQVDDPLDIQATFLIYDPNRQMFVEDERVKICPQSDDFMSRRDK